ncbi:hypothetical protein [Streptomyces sp. NPDC093089]|uniref:hypothetical protein n=1 Tax=Streptomyces sp. NPDC093089 TaxID=3366024 RepID=UPI003822BFAF
MDQCGDRPPGPTPPALFSAGCGLCAPVVPGEPLRYRNLPPARRQGELTCEPGQLSHQIGLGSDPGAAGLGRSPLLVAQQSPRYEQHLRIHQ